MNFREISDCLDDIAVLRRFFNETYLSQFPIRDERESLENMTEYLRLKASGWYGKNNYHIVLGEADRPLAGSISDYLAEPNSGVIEFLTVADDLRQSGRGWQLLEETERLLAEDAARNGRTLDCIVAEMNDPFKQGAIEDSLDPFVRAAIWDKWGYRKLDFAYIQPALSREQSPVTGLLLMVKSSRMDFEHGIPADTMKSILREYMRWAMRISEPEQLEAYRLMSRAIDQRGVVPVVRLAHYVGRDDERPLVIRPIVSEHDPDLGGVLAVYAQAFPGGPTDISPEVLRDAVAARNEDPTARYHLWAIRSGPARDVEGMASFFTFPEAGFGGYVTLAGSLRGAGRVPLLLARVEERMIRDAVGAKGWFIECDPRQEGLFEHHGFRTVDCAYRQPRLPGVSDQSPDASPELRLMYKEFGRNFEVPTIASALFLAAITRIFSVVYRIERVDEEPGYRAICEDARRWANGVVRFR